MKNLKLFVEGDNLKLDSGYNPRDLFPGMKESVRLEFDFPPDWKNRVKVAAFWSVMGKEFPPQIIEDGKTCLVPTEALQGAVFKVQILGKKNGEKASTTKCTVYLKGGRV